MSETIWMVRAGRGGDLLESFLEGNAVAIGFDFLDDLSRFQTREQVQTALAAQRSALALRKRQMTMASSQLFRFAHEIQLNDRVLTYDSSTRDYHLGRVTGPYIFNPSLFPNHPHVRPVEWAGKIDRDSLSPKTRHGLGSISTLFMLSDEASSEIVARSKGETACYVGDPREEGEPEDESEILEDVQERSREFIKDKVSALDPYQMQELVAGLLRAMGYKTKVSARGADRGKDIVASPDGFGFEQPRIVVEVKHRPNDRTGAPLIRSFLGGRHKDDKGLYVSTGGFANDAKYEADRASIPLTLMDLDDLVEGVTDYYDRMDSETRALIPLVRVWWPG